MRKQHSNLRRIFIKVYLLLILRLRNLRWQETLMSARINDFLSKVLAAVYCTVSCDILCMSPSQLTTELSPLSPPEQRLKMFLKALSKLSTMHAPVMFSHISFSDWPYVSDETIKR